MSFKSINRILVALENQAEWQEPQQFRRLLACWPEIIGSKISAQTRPISISRDVLWVATASSALANTLTFQRQSLLKKLKAQISLPLVDIRFSTAQWQNTTDPNLASVIEEKHRSHVVETMLFPPTPPISAPKDASTTFQQWAELIQARSQHLPLCPQCQCSTPIGELQRWDVCGFCASQQWSNHRQ